MLKRLPILPTLIVLAAVAVMVGLGIWQLQRALWKDGLLVRLEANRDLPAMRIARAPRADVEARSGVDPNSLDTADMPDADGIDATHFRRATAFCADAGPARTVAGRSAAGTSGWSYLATCSLNRTGEGTLVVDIGWSPRFDVAPNWRGGEVAGTLVPDEAAGQRLVAANAAPGLEPSQPPGPDTIPNNHLFYAAQWFFFAAAAATIYALAVRKRWIKPAS